MNFASGQILRGHRLKASSVNDGDGDFTALTFFVLPSRSNVASCTSVTRSTSPSVSARSTASALPYLIHWISSNFGFGPRNSLLRSIRTIRLESNSVTTYGPLPTIGIVGR